MVLIDTNETSDGTEYIVHTKAKSKPDLGFVDNQAQAERKARGELLAKRRTLRDDELVLKDIVKKHEDPFAMRAEWKVTFLKPDE